MDLSFRLSSSTRRPARAGTDIAQRFFLSTVGLAAPAGVDPRYSGPRLNLKPATMATRAELFRYRQERKGPDRPKRPPRPRRDRPVNTALPGVSATDRKVGGNSTAARNVSKSAGRKAAYQLEDSVARLPPSRKSTRGGANKQKQSVQLWGKQLRATTSPSQRARRGR
jgi:hypothetical protein